MHCKGQLCRLQRDLLHDTSSEKLSNKNALTRGNCYILLLNCVTIVLHPIPTAILLGHLKMPIDEIYRAVLGVDESKLTEPHIKTLQMCAPERLEVDIVVQLTFSFPIVNLLYSHLFYLASVFSQLSSPVT